TQVSSAGAAVLSHGSGSDESPNKAALVNPLPGRTVTVPDGCPVPFRPRSPLGRDGRLFPTPLSTLLTLLTNWGKPLWVLRAATPRNHVRYSQRIGSSITSSRAGMTLRTAPEKPAPAPWQSRQRFRPNRQIREWLR